MKILSTVFLAIGISFLGVGLWWSHVTQRFLARAQTVDGVVVALDPRQSSNTGTTYAPVVEFQPPGAPAQRYTESFASNPPSYTVGERVRVYYDPAQPSSARLNGFFSLWFGPLLFGGLGAVFALIGGVVLLLLQRRRRRDAELRANGQRLLADFKTVERNMLLRINHRHPFRIVAQGYDPVSRQPREFRSRNLMTDPSPYLTGGKHIKWTLQVSC